MLQDQLKQEFGNLSEGEVSRICNSVSATLLKVQKVSTQREAQNFIKETLTKLLNPSYRQRFEDLLLGINPKGLAKSNSFQRTLQRNMRCRYSIYKTFSDASTQKDYEGSKMKQAVHNARHLHAAMPCNSVITIIQ